MKRGRWFFIILVSLVAAIVSTSTSCEGRLWAVRPKRHVHPGKFGIVQMKLPRGESVVWNALRPEESMGAQSIRAYDKIENSDDVNGGGGGGGGDAAAASFRARLRRRKFSPSERTFHQIVRNSNCYLQTSSIETEAFIYRRNRFMTSASNYSSSSSRRHRRGGGGPTPFSLRKRLDVNSTCVLHSLPYSTNVTIRNTATQGNVRCIANDQYLNESGVPDGTGIVGVSIDTGLDVNHAFFYDFIHPVTYVTYTGNAFPSGSVTTSDHSKIKMYVATGSDEEFRRDFLRGHGSHTAGINVGFPVSSFSGGMNPGAKIIVVDAGGDVSSPDSLTIPDNLMGIFETAVNYGAVYSTSSWGSDSPLYDAFSYQFDTFAYENRHFTHVVSAGNAGGPTILTSPANCKNCLVVGATMIDPEGHRDRYADVDSNPKKYQWNDLASFTSYGTTIEGRVSPTVWTAGVDVYSASADPGITPDLAPHMTMRFSSGTSMAAPALPIARLYQMLELARNNTVPSSSLIRAVVLANTVASVGLTVTGALYTNPIASHASNPGLFGVFHPRPGFWTTLRNWILLDDLVVPSGDNWRRCFASGNLSDFVVVLAWTDPPYMGADSASSYLVHDLDMVVNAFENSTWYGNMRTHTDTLHNHEIVRIATPRNSTIRITVSDVSASSQEFSLAIYSVGGLTEIACNSTCTDTELALECDYEDDGLGVHFCKETGEWDLTTCHPYACLNGKVFSSEDGCVDPPSSTSTSSCRVRNGNGMNVSGTCMITECDESYWYNGTGCTCYGTKSSGSGLRLACLASGVFETPPAVRTSDANRVLSSLTSLVVVVIFTLLNR